LLVRHGESEWNAVGRWQGQADPRLTDLGRHQAKAAATAIGAVDAVWTSPLHRAAETAVIISDAIGVGPVVVDDDLMERDAGEWSGLTRAEIEARYPGWLEGTSAFEPGQHRRPPGWEPDDHLLARALVAIGRVAGSLAPAGGDVVAITHGGLIYAVESHLGARFARIANLAGRWIEVGARDGGLRLGGRVQLVDPHEVAVTVPDQL
jgi:probable phosphoglycerate mutase